MVVENATARIAIVLTAVTGSEGVVVTATVDTSSVLVIVSVVR